MYIDDVADSVESGAVFLRDEIQTAHDFIIRYSKERVMRGTRDDVSPFIPTQVLNELISFGPLITVEAPAPDNVRRSDYTARVCGEAHFVQRAVTAAGRDGVLSLCKPRPSFVEDAVESHGQKNVGERNVHVGIRILQCIVEIGIRRKNAVYEFLALGFEFDRLANVYQLAYDYAKSHAYALILGAPVFGDPDVLSVCHIFLGKISSFAGVLEVLQVLSDVFLREFKVLQKLSVNVLAHLFLTSLTESTKLSILVVSGAMDSLEYSYEDSIFTRGTFISSSHFARQANSMLYISSNTS